MVSKAVILSTILVLVLSLLVNYGASYESENDDYCRKDICPEGRPNVGCGCGSTYGPGCSGKNPRRVDMDQQMKALILDEHNKRRNELTCGSIEGHAPAAEMSEVTWDDELTHLAWCNAKNCVYGHDQCRSTREFYYAGQNIAQKMVCGKTVPSAEQVTVSSIDVWFQEHQNTTAAMTDSFPEKVPGNNGPIGHFTLMCNDRVRRIGCTLVIYEEQRKRAAKKPCQKHYLVCNYSYGNFVGEKTYTKGPAAELCRDWSEQYPCLCGTKQPYRKPE